MNILVLNGSPKCENSNTLKLTNAFLEGISERTAANIEILNVSKLNIHDCRGCFYCWYKTPGKCVFDDDMPGIINKLLIADVVIWSFPLYYYSLPSRLKMLIDRQLPMLLPFMDRNAPSGGHEYRYDMSGKRYVLISTCGFYTAEGNYNSVIAQFDRIYGKNNFTSIFCGQGELFSVPELRERTNEYLQAVKTAGSEFADGSITDKTMQKLNQLLFPREVYEQMSDASWGIDKGKP
ncbi:MAG: flavodoxin family protein [Clostridiaceae bacterium]|nr:flavodoxin family protein [Clostridiaceae bacterium]